MSNMPTQTDLDALNAEIAEAENVLRDLRQRRRAMLVAGYDGAEVGSMVRCTRGTWKGKIGMVAEVKIFGQNKLPAGRPWVRVRLFKKDGTLGDRIVWLFTDWEVVRDLG